MFPRSIRKSFFAAAAALVFVSSLTAAQTAPIVSYQGLLTTTAGSPLADAEYQVTFRLYSGSTEMWKESQKLKTVNGLFAAALGSVNPFASDFFTKNPSLQLSVQVGSEAEYPKTALNMTPYAASANAADSALKSGVADIAKQTFGSGIVGAVETDKVIAKTDAGLTLVNKAGQGIVIDKSGKVTAGNMSIGTSPSAINDALVINGPNVPYDVNSSQAIRWQFAAAGSSAIRSYRGASWGTSLQFLTNSASGTSDKPEVRMELNQDGNVYLSGRIAQDSWAPISLASGWTGYGADYAPASYFIDKNGIVHLRGLIKTADEQNNLITEWTTIAQLPVSPEFVSIYSCYGSKGACRIDIRPNGAIQAVSNCWTGWISLEGITFRAR